MRVPTFAAARTSGGQAATQRPERMADEGAAPPGRSKAPERGGKSYRAAVCEHTPVGSVGVDGAAMDVARRNMELYRAAAGWAAGGGEGNKDGGTGGGAQIIVYPEWGLLGASDAVSRRDRMVPFAQPVGDAGDDLLAQPSGGEYSIVRELASIAKDCGIVVVANVCEKAADAADAALPVYYNTEVAISEDGILLAKYHKMHPFFTRTFDRPQEREVVTFETSFGVRFGLFICKDLCHSEPQRSLLDGSRAHGGATQIPFSVAAPHTFLVRWFYRRWSEKRGATLLASNRGGGGGIFAGGKGGKSHVVKRHGCTVATIHL